MIKRNVFDSNMKISKNPRSYTYPHRLSSDKILHHDTLVQSYNIIIQHVPTSDVNDFVINACTLYYNDHHRSQYIIITFMAWHFSISLSISVFFDNSPPKSTGTHNKFKTTLIIIRLILWCLLTWHLFTRGAVDTMIERHPT